MGPTAGRRDCATSPPTSAPNNFHRLRIGIGDRENVDATDFVLSQFKSAERPVIDDALILASQAVAVWVTQGIDAAMNRFNGGHQPSNHEPTEETASCQPNTYEGMFLLDSAKAATAWDDTVKHVHDILTKHQSEIVASRQWDERRLAYPIRRPQKRHLPSDLLPD